MEQVTKLINTLRDQLKLGRYRLMLGWVLGIIIVVFASHLPSVLGMVIFFAGCLVRFWSNGCIRKNEVLATDGPYRFTRNPLYVGSFLMIFGAALSVLAWWLALIFGLIFLIIYYDEILKEEKNLLEIFGEAYQDYMKKVPRFFPLPWQYLPHNKQAEPPFSWQQAIKNRGYEAFAMMLLFYVGVVAVVWLKHKIGI